MKITVIDAQGGGIGRNIVASIKKEYPQTDITAIGTNGIAAAAMLKAGADRAASGENPFIVACRNAELIIGPIGIVIADSLLGEITPKMAVAAAQSSAKKLFIPFNQCGNIIVGVKDLSMKSLMANLMEEIDKLMKGTSACE